MGFLQNMDAGKEEVFQTCVNRNMILNPITKILKPLPKNLGSQKNSWKYVWQLYATAPHKYPEIEDLLRLAKPADLGTGIFALPEESWPQVNEQKEEALGQALDKSCQDKMQKKPWQF